MALFAHGVVDPWSLHFKTRFWPAAVLAVGEVRRPLSRKMRVVAITRAKIDINPIFNSAQASERVRGMWSYL